MSAPYPEMPYMNVYRTYRDPMPPGLIDRVLESLSDQGEIDSLERTELGIPDPQPLAFEDLHLTVANEPAYPRKKT